MRLFRTTLALLLVLSFSLLAAVPVGAASDTSAFATDQIIVKFKAGTDQATQGKIHRKYGGAVVAEIKQLGVKVIGVPAGSVLGKVRAYRSEQAVAFAEPDFIAEAIGVPDDPYYGNQWGLSKVEAPQAWDITTGSSSIRIAILDTGVDQDHVDLAKIVANKNFTSSSTVDDLHGHGTHVAGIAAASTNNGIGVAGLGYYSVIMNGKVLDDSGSGYYSWIASGITWAADNGAKVINMSLGGSYASSTLEAAVNYAWNKGVVVVAAAGNSDSSSIFYPAGYANCIAVAATDQNDAKASFSNYGSWVDVAAPGVSIYSTLPNHRNRIGGTNYGSLSGTSMASPFVAGLAGLVWSTSHGIDNANVRNRIESTADPISGTGTYWQHGRINAYNAVAPSTPQPPSLSVNVSAPDLINENNFTVHATVANSGDTTATEVKATIKLPLGLSTGESLTKAMGDIEGKASATASWSVIAEADGKYEVMVAAAATDVDTASGKATVTVDTTPPAQVSGLTVMTVSSNQLDLSWYANTESDLSHYNVYRSTGSGDSYALIASPAANSYSDTALAAATTYYYVVSAVDTIGNEGAKSPEAYGTTSLAVANEIHIDSIDMSLTTRTAGKNKFTSAIAIVTIVDAGGSPVSGVTVSGHWSGATSDTDSAVTDSSGQATIQSDSVKNVKSGTTFTFTVDDVVLSGWDYNSTANVETSDSILVP